MKILITTPSFPPFNSGLGNAVYRQAAMLESLGFKVVIATSGLNRNTRIDLQLKVAIEEFNVSGSDSLINPLRGDVSSYKKFLINTKFDLILMNAWQTWTTDICLKYHESIAGKKILYSHCLSTNLFLFEQPFKSFLRYILWRPYYFKVKGYLRRLDALICLASGGDSRFDDVGIARKVGAKLYIVPNVLSEEATYYLNTPSESMQARNQLISVGSYDWMKGHDFVLEAYSKSAAKNIIPLKIFGQEFTNLTHKLKEQAVSLGIKDEFIEFYENVSGKELLEQYRKSLAFLYGSRTECQPLVILDAMASGTPFISRATGCISELPGGFAVDDVESAAKKLDLIIADKVEWENLSSLGVVEAKIQYNSNDVSKRLVSAIIEVLE